MNGETGIPGVALGFVALAASCHSNLWDLCCWGLRRDYRDTAQDAENFGKDSFVKLTDAKETAEDVKRRHFPPPSHKAHTAAARCTVLTCVRSEGKYPR